jgi:hypothetical protein
VLVRVLAVAQRLEPLEDQDQRRGQVAGRAAREVDADRAVVGRGVRERFGRQLAPQRGAGAPTLQRLQDRAVVGRIHDRDHGVVVLRS